MASSDGLMWKFKGSTGPFNTLSTVTLPCDVALVREKLKISFGLAESTSIDFVIYLESNPNSVLSDYYVLQPNSRILARRCASEEASALITEANSLFKNTDREADDEEESFRVVDDDLDEGFMGTLDDLYQGSASNTAGLDDDDEDLKIAEIIKGQSFYDSKQTDSLSRRYYKNRTLLPGQGVVNQLPGQALGSQTTGTLPTVPGLGGKLLGEVDDHNEIIHVDADYICHMCGQKGHHIRNCTNTDGKRLSKKIRASTGIPVDFLTPINAKDIGKYEEVYIMKDGSFAIMREAESVSGGAFFTKTVDQRIQVQLGISEKDSQILSKGFKCTICSCYFNNPVTTLCCGETFCLDCIIGNKSQKMTSKIICPTCHRSIKMTDLQSNTSLKKAVQSLILGNVDVLKTVQEEAKEPSPSVVENKFEKPSGLNVETLKRQKLVVDSYLAKYRTYEAAI